MKTVIIGGGKGGKAIIELAAGPFLRELTLDIVCVVDIDPQAPALLLAREMGLQTCADMIEALALPGIELIIELTGDDQVIEQLYKLHPPGCRLIDHTFAHIFWDLVNAQKDRDRRLKEITELEKKVELERRLLRSTFDTLPELVVVLDNDQRIRRINASFSRFIGLGLRTARGKTCTEVLTRTELADLSRELPPLFDAVLDTGRPRSLTWQTAEPEEAYWEVSLTPILNEELEIDGIVGTWHRITEKIILHRKIESAEARFKSFIDSAHDWISIKDSEGRYVIVNPICAEAFGRKPEDFIGKTPKEMLDPEQYTMIRKHDDQVRHDNFHHTYDEIFVIDGRERHYQTVRFPLTDYTGGFSGICTIARDVTAEIDLRDQLVQSTKLAAVGKLAAGVAHEINNPLTGVLAFAEDIKEELPEGDPMRDDIRVIIRETMRCRSIVRNLLDFARHDKLNLKKVGANQIVEQSLSLVHRLPQFRNVTIHQTLSDKIPLMVCDQQQVQQVILNLMMNAAEAMQGNGIISLNTAYDRQHNRCEITIEDDGPGVPEKLIEQVFEPFFSTKGTNGLGLAVSWGIIERHRGVIEIKTAEGGGAIFRILIPAADDEEI
ncbi:MAG: PAS domain-containing protein [FCB group bacterium]|nr:PAS domain-containing protein [FCB group bacterium]